MAPAYVANMSPPFMKYWRGGNRPINRRWLGSHKTVMGFAAGLLAAVTTTFVQHVIGWQTGIVDDARWFELGLRFGVGAMTGDSAKSFLKGQAWVPFDQLDFALGALVFVAPRAALGAGDIAVVLVLSVGGHIVVNHLA